MHTATKKLADGRVTYYAYAWRKGPLIARATDASKDAAFAALQELLTQPEALAKLSAAREVKTQKAAPTVAYIAGMVLAYLKSPEYNSKKPRTRSDYRKHLNLFRDEFGDWRTALFEDPRIAQDLAEWRDGFNSPRQGHMQIQVISMLFGWARSRGMTKANPTEAIKKVYSADRSGEIWLPDQVEAVLSKSPEPLQWAIKLAVETGMRQGDLITLPWSAVSDLAIQMTTAKRGKRVLIPITDRIRDVLAEIPKRSPIVLTSSSKRPWTDTGMRSSFDRAKKRAKISGLTWHDFRGTAVTRLYNSGLTLRDLSRIFGWSEGDIEAILTRYVSADEVAKNMLERISAEHKRQTD
jgi:integrase